MPSFKVLARLKGGHVWLRLRSILLQTRFSFEVICLSAAVWCVTFTVIHLYFYTSILLLLYWVLNTFLNLINLLLKGSFTIFLFFVRTHILDSNEVWYSWFWSEGSINALNPKFLDFYFVPRDLVSRRHMGPRMAAAGTFFWATGVVFGPAAGPWGEKPPWKRGRVGRWGVGTGWKEGGTTSEAGGSLKVMFSSTKGAHIIPFNQKLLLMRALLPAWVSFLLPLHEAFTSEITT